MILECIVCSDLSVPILEYFHGNLVDHEYVKTNPAIIYSAIGTSVGQRSARDQF